MPFPEVRGASFGSDCSIAKSVGFRERPYQVAETGFQRPDWLSLPSSRRQSFGPKLSRRQRRVAAAGLQRRYFGLPKSGRRISVSSYPGASVGSNFSRAKSVDGPTEETVCAVVRYSAHLLRTILCACFASFYAPVRRCSAHLLRAVLRVVLRARCAPFYVHLLRTVLCACFALFCVPVGRCSAHLLRAVLCAVLRTCCAPFCAPIVRRFVRLFCALFRAILCAVARCSAHLLRTVLCACFPSFCAPIRRCSAHLLRCFRLRLGLQKKNRDSYRKSEVTPLIGGWGVEKP